ncbi:MAG: transporter substrate-binding domain-containing protein [Desulfobacterium sp.]|nr:transporter substrate-binding domain-containing protein [Desulfobacterium sp.]
MMNYFWIALMAIALTPSAAQATPEPVQVLQSASLKEMTLTAEDKSWLQDHPIIRIGVDPNWPPLEFFDDNGIYSGMASDYARIFCERLNIAVTPLRFKNWTEVTEKAASKEVDMLPFSVNTPGRSRHLLFTRPFLNFPIVIMTRVNSPKFTGLKDLANQIVAIPVNSYTHEFLKKDYPGLRLLLTDNIGTALKAVAHGKADAVVGNLASISYLTRKMGLLHLKVAALTPYEYKLCIGVRKDWPELVKILDKALRELSDEEKNRIYDKWFGDQFEPEFDWVARIITSIATLLAVSIFMVFIYLRWKKRLSLEITEHRRTETALKKSRQSFRALVSNLPGIVYSMPCNLENSGYFISDRIEEISGYPGSDFQNNSRSYLSIIHPQDVHRVATIQSKARKNEGSFEIEYRIVRADNDIRWVHERGTSVKDADEKIQWIDGIILDITRHKQVETALKRNEDYLKSILEGSNRGFIFIDNDAIIKDLNPAMCEIFNQERSRLMEMSLYKFLDRKNTAIFKDQLRLRNLGQKSAYELCMHKDDGQKIVVYWAASPYYDKAGKKQGSFGIVDDITRRKEIESELHRARCLAEEASKAKGFLLAGMSHEIKTPMNAIIGLTHLTLQTELTEKQHEYISKIESSSHLLLGLLNKILDVSKLNAQKIELESVPFSIHRVIESISGLVCLGAREKGLAVNIRTIGTIPPVLVGDPLRLGQVLTNLVNNAIKFTEAGKIDIFLEPEKLESTVATLKFSIHDTGIGITSEQRKKLFKPFSQADVSTTRKYGGTGLGLTISKRLVELMEGMITVESILGKGSIFRFTARFGLPGEEISLDHDLDGPMAQPPNLPKEPTPPLTSTCQAGSNIKELLTSLEELGIHVKKRQPKPCRKALKQARQLWGHGETATELTRLEKLIKSYKFKESQTVLESLINQLKL